MEQQDNGAIAPEVPVTAEAEPQPTAPQTEGTEPKSADETPPAEKTFTQAELDAILEKKTAKLIRQREQERAKREVYEQQLTKIQPVQPTSGKPHISQFNDAEAYAEAVSEWKLEQKAQEERAQQSQRSQSQFQTKRDDFIAELEETDGFDMKQFNKLPISVVMAEAILDSDLGTKLALHLTTHPDDASRIAALSPARQAAEIGKLEAKLAATQAKKPSNAPSPISPVGGKGSSVTADIYDQRLASDTAAWIAARNRQLKGK